MYKRVYLVLAFGLLYSAGFAQKKTDVKKVERLVAAVIKKVMPATVKIAAFDTLSKTLAISRFSGVLVSADGLILTAAHATQPKQIYQVAFPDGRKVLAKGLGRIALGKDKPASDVAMMQLIEKGKWPYAEMGYSSEMRAGQPCIGISFPGTFEQQQPNVRLGRLEKVDIEKGNFQSSCKMEPGDSGGALFDEKGRLIGIHSWILPNEEQNFEVPIALYQKYWDALHIPISYDYLPKAMAIQNKKRSKIADSIAPLDLINKLTLAETSTVLSIRSIIKGKLVFALGTVVQLNDRGKTVNLIVSKNTIVGDEVLIGGKQFSAKVVYRDVENDLVLLSTNEDLPQGIDISRYVNNHDIEPGKMLFSPLGDGKTKGGIASTREIEMKLKYSIGYFGAGAEFIGGKVTIIEIAKGCPADGIVQKSDQVLTINRVKIEKPEQYGAELAKYYPNDTVSIGALRQGQPITLKVILGVFRANAHTADAFPGGRSARSDGFKNVTAQDAALKPNECGGPVFNVDGGFVGINIGRHSRTSTIIMPVNIIAGFCARYIAL